jgi:hypothetical protein
MAIECSRTIVNIRDLPTTESVVPGDLLIVETIEGGTNVLDFANLLIPIENTLFQSVIESNTTDIISLSAAIDINNNAFNQSIQNQNSQITSISAAVQRSNTFATFSLNSEEVVLLKGSNIQENGITFNPSLSTVRFSFIENFPDTNYCVTANGKSGTQRVNMIITDISTSSITLCASNHLGNNIPLERGWVNIITV